MPRTTEKNLQADLENAKTELCNTQKQQKKIEKPQKEVDKLGTIASKEKETNTPEEGLNSTKPLYDLRDQESELERQNWEDKALINYANTSPCEKEAAEARVAEREDEKDTLGSHANGSHGTETPCLFPKKKPSTGYPVILLSTSW